MTDWSQPQDVTDLDMVFGTRAMALMPPYSEIPDEFRNMNDRTNPWLRLQRDWFYGGISRSQITPRDDVDLNRAVRHLKAIQGSFEPKHEHKEAGVAYLASLWFVDYSPAERVR